MKVTIMASIVSIDLPAHSDVSLPNHVQFGFTRKFSMYSDCTILTVK